MHAEMHGTELNIQTQIGADTSYCLVLTRSAMHLKVFPIAPTQALFPRSWAKLPGLQN